MSKFVDYFTAVGDDGCQRQKIGLNIMGLSSQGVAPIDQIPKTIKNGVQQGWNLLFPRTLVRNPGLESAQERLIIVCPWLTRSAINGEVIRKFRAILNRHCQIDIGWGHLSDTGLSQPIQLCRQRLLCAVSRKNQGWKYNALPELEQLEQEYPGQFRLRLLGTHDSYLVCDRSFAMLGSHNFLTSGTSSSERELGLQTNDPRLIKDLIQRFESAKSLELPQSNIAPPVMYNVQILEHNLADVESANAALNE